MRKGQSGQAKKAQARTSASPSTHSRQARRISLSCLLILAPAGGHAGPSFAQLAAVWRGSRAAVAGLSGFWRRDGEAKLLLEEPARLLVLAALDEEMAGAPDEPVPRAQDQELDVPPEVAHGGLAFICSASRLRGGRGGGGGGTRSTGAGPRAIRV